MVLHLLSIDDGDEAAEPASPKTLGEALDTVLDSLSRRIVGKSDRTRLRGGLDAADVERPRDQQNDAVGQISRGMRVTGGAA